MAMVDDDSDVIGATDAVSAVLHEMRLPLDVAHWARRLETDGLFAQQMALCLQWGIPHSQFLSWPRVDQEKALAYQQHEAARCRDCGVHPDDWPEDSGFDEAPPFEVEATRCYGCVAVYDYMTSLRKANTEGSTVDERAMKGVRTRFMRPRF